jgi:hypothetical protein
MIITFLFVSQLAMQSEEQRLTLLLEERDQELQKAVGKMF